MYVVKLNLQRKWSTHVLVAAILVLHPFGAVMMMMIFMILKETIRNRGDERPKQPFQQFSHIYSIYNQLFRSFPLMLYTMYIYVIQERERDSETEVLKGDERQKLYIYISHQFNKISSFFKLNSITSNIFLQKASYLINKMLDPSFKFKF